MALSVAPKLFASDRSRAWLLTLTSALVMTVGGLGFAFAFFASTEQINHFPLLDVGWANAICSCFISFLAADMVLGYLYFKSEVNWLTGWVHHIGYSIVVFGCIQHRVAGGFLTFASLLELPSIPLSLGHIKKAWRRDYLFGVLFFATRVLVNFYVILHVRVAYPHSNFYLVTAAPLPLHIFWFYNWVQQQIRIRKHKHTDTATAATVKKME
ncbi:hypothetical protein SmJEL517_g03306 [Synchytrium microbalum]|uniref:TLC domain-containing protein n=1 Tax=Synchytrium microbalum TaxID=1806994 RepID=A0A507C424_9FUNG|nr:uncharacterized protein SmJEL517_g03306 [Synchytrium microbalum]TPX33839.1 hypothetical protein SmJEL517_g03306 [Synchytrium microbalum]